MDCSSVCEKTRMRMVEENSKKISFTLLIKPSFWLEIFALNLVEKTLLMKWEKLAQSPLEILEKNNVQTPKFIGLEKLAVGGLTELSVDRPVDQPTVRFLTVEPSVDRGQDTESTALCPVDRSVDRGLSREQSSLDGRPGRSAGPPARTGVHVCARRSTGSVDRLKPGQNCKGI